MCGIFGIIGEKNSDLNKSIKKLFLLSETRGKEASGLAVYNGPTIKVLKGNTPPSLLVKSKNYIQFLKEALLNKNDYSISLIGHSRLVTDGQSDMNYNNQPVIKDGFVIVHNGIITNVDYLFEKYSKLLRSYEIDTEILPSLIKFNMEQGKNIIASIVAAIREIEGSASLAFLSSEYEKTFLTTNTGSLYWMKNNEKSQCVFASEKYILKKFSQSISGYTNSTIEQINSSTGIVVDNNSLETIFFHFDSTPVSPQILKNPTTAKIIDNSPLKETFHRVSYPAIQKRDSDNILEYNSDKISKLKRCSKCTLPETFPFISFDKNGVCNYCLNYKKTFDLPDHIKETKKKTFIDIIDTYRKPNNDPDVIVPFSGGRDSSFGLHYIKNILGLNPITFTYDWGMITDLARRNIARICGKLGIENIIISADIIKKRKFIRDNVNAWLKKPDLGMIPLFMAGDKYFFHHANSVKKQTGINLNIWMGNRLEDTNFKNGFAGIKPGKKAKAKIYSLGISNIFKQATYYLKGYIRNVNYFNTSIIDVLGAYIVYYFEPRKDTCLLYDYIDWDENEIEHTLIKEYNWETSSDTRSTWRIGDGTAAFYDYIYYTVAGFSEIDTFRSNQIRENMLTREEALDLVTRENKPRFESIQWYCDTIGINFRETMERINDIPKLY